MAKIVAHYDYTDQSGKLLYQAVRFEPKDFRQRRPVGSGWEWNLNGVERVPYNLQALMKNKSQPVFIVEGEKDVESLKAIGLLASCNVCGAGKWTPNYNRYFLGRSVYVIPDNDVPGRAHATSVAEILWRWAHVKIVNLPEGKDVTDWLAAGHTRKELEYLAQIAEVFRRAVLKKTKVEKNKILFKLDDDRSLEKAKQFPLWKLLGLKPKQKAPCLWHEDKHPSLQLYPDGGGFCFVCNKPYDSIDWIMKRDGVNFTTAVRTLSYA